MCMTTHLVGGKFVDGTPGSCSIQIGSQINFVLNRIDFDSKNRVKGAETYTKTPGLGSEIFAKFAPGELKFASKSA